MNISENTIIGELVAEDYRTALVFKKHKIDFCCQGARTISEACEKKNADIIQIVEELDAIHNHKEKPATDFQQMELDDLVNHIEKIHHQYVTEAIPIITQYLTKVCKVHGAHHPELLEINELFTGCAGELSQHMMKEELILFPFVKRLAQAQNEGTEIIKPGFGSVQNPIAMMMHEHSNEGERFRKIAALTNDYQPPAEACNTYRVVFGLLKDFEEDLHLHIHLENNILFPKAVILEQQLN